MATYSSIIEIEFASRDHVLTERVLVGGKVIETDAAEREWDYAEHGLDPALAVKSVTQRGNELTKVGYRLLKQMEIGIGHHLWRFGAR